MNNTPSTEERVWAVISHLSAIAFGMGLLLPVIGWSEQRRKSKYASFQCLQALGYQSLGYTVWILGSALLIIFFMLVMFLVIGIAGDDRGAVSTSITLFTGLFMAIFFGSFAVYFLLPVIAAISCGLGRDFRYPILGTRLAKYLGYDAVDEADDGSAWLIEDHEDRWVAAMGHFSVILPIWGLLAPITAWVVQGKRSLFLKFQSIQTVAYQVLVNGIYMVSGIIPMFGVLFLFAFTGLESGPAQPTTPTQMIGLLIFGLTMLISMLIILLMPLLHILGQWAGYRVLKGDNYHYPLIGRWTERWSQKGPILATVEAPQQAVE
jgi:uncharacterized Tic20 family protein